MSNEINTRRCPWAKDEYDIRYHDTEWGRPEHNDRKLFEMLVLEGMQAGLSWNLILRRREGMRKAFDNFEPEIVATYGDDKKAELLTLSAVIKNRAKINALVTNARCFLEVQKEFGSFDRYVWGFVNGQAIQNNWQEISEMPVTSPVSDALSADLRRRGFKFAGPTICYSYMQAIGMVNDHLVGCTFHQFHGGSSGGT